MRARWRISTWTWTGTWAWAWAGSRRMCAGAAALVVRAGARPVARHEGVDVHMGWQHAVRGGVLLGPVEVPQDLMEGAIVHRPAGGAGVRLMARWVLRREVRGLRGGRGVRLRSGWVGRIRAAVRSGAIICSVAATPHPRRMGREGAPWRSWRA